MLDLDKAKNDWDDLDIYDRESADIRRALNKIDLLQWCKDLKELDPQLFEKIYKNLYLIRNTKT
jgi:hypothetical protein